MTIFYEKQAVSWFKKVGNIQKMINVGKISDKDDILTVEEKITLIGNKTKRSLWMAQWQRELEARWLEVAKMRIKIDWKGKYFLSDIGGKFCFKVLTYEALKCYKKKNRDRTIKIYKWICTTEEVSSWPQT